MSVGGKNFRFFPASYPITLGFDDVDKSSQRDAMKAVLGEYHDANTWKRLRCQNVRRIWGEDAEPLFELQLDHTPDFDWSWEDAEAFRPIKMDEIGRQESTVFDSTLWAGQIIEFDDAKNLLYVLADNSNEPPRKGSFFVRPFEFLRTLNEIYNGEAFRERKRLLDGDLTIRQRIAGRLNAALGDAPYLATTDRYSRNTGLPELRSWWQKSWCILWGPPGTGKTYTTAHQIAAVLGSEIRVFPTPRYVKNRAKHGRSRRSSGAVFDPSVGC